MMNRKYAFLLKGVVLGAVVLGNVMPAYALGESKAKAKRFQGNGSRIIDTGKPGPVLPVTIKAEKIKTKSNTTSSVHYFGNNIFASATTSDYGFSGSVAASGYANAWRAGGYFHDEVAFRTVNPGTYSIDFIFNVNANAQLYKGGQTDLAMTLSYWDGQAYASQDTKYLLSASGNNINKSVSGKYQLSLTGIDSTNFINGGNTAFLPYTIGLWAGAVNGSISWCNVVLTDVFVKDSQGVILNPASYDLNSDSLAFNSVTAQAPVPVPGAVWLLGFGLAGLAAVRRRESKRLPRMEAETGICFQGQLVGN